MFILHDDSSDVSEHMMVHYYVVDTIAIVEQREHADTIDVA